MLFSGTVLQPPILENLMKIVVIDTETIRWSDEVPGRWDNVENFGVSILVLGIPNNGSLEFQVCSPNYADHLSRLQLQFSDRETIEKVLNEAERIVSFNADNFDFRILESVQFDVQQWREKMALSCNPSLLIADEPTTALDVTIQAQVLDLMRELQEELGMAIMMITHDLGVIAEITDEVVVMYAGRVVEKGNLDQIFYHPLHPYTRGLLESIPVLGINSHKRLHSIAGSVPRPLAMPPGCAFAPRCTERFERCSEMPELKAVDEHNSVRCWIHETH